MKRLISWALLLTLLLTLLVTAPAQAAQYGTVRGGWLRLRSDPSYGAYNVIGSYRTGTVVTILGEYGGWYHVTTPDGKTGYMVKTYITLSGGYTPTVPEWHGTPSGETGYVYSANGRGVRLRSTPQVTGYNVIGLYSVGTRLTILERGSYWHRVSIGSQTGYMMAQYIRTDTSPTPPGDITWQITYVSPYSAYVTSGNGGNVWFRLSPSTSSGVYGSYPVGTRVTVLGYWGSWSYIQIGGQTGWMMSAFLTTGGMPMPQPTSTPLIETVGILKGVSLSSMSPYVGAMLSVITSPSGADVNVYWYNELHQQVGTGRNYTVQYSDLGHRLYAYAEGRGNWQGTASSSMTSAVVGGGSTPSSGALTGIELTITDPIAGDKLHALVYPDGANADITWYNDLNVLVGTGAYYQTTAADVGRRFKAQAVGKGTWLGSVSTGYTKSVKGTGGAVSLPIEGMLSLPVSARVNDVIASALSGCNAPASVLKYTWYIGAQVVGSGSTLKVSAEMAAKELRLVLTADGFMNSLTAKCYIQPAGETDSGFTAPVEKIEPVKHVEPVEVEPIVPVVEPVIVEPIVPVVEPETVEPVVEPVQKIEPVVIEPATPESPVIIVDPAPSAPGVELIVPGT